LSGEYVGKLKRRALSFLKEAEEAVDKDLAAFFAEQAMQLYLKATFYELFGDRVKGHGLRELLSAFSKSLERSGHREAAERIREFVGEFRGKLILAEDAYTGARYGDLSYDQRDVNELLEVARRLISLLNQVIEIVKLG